MDQKGLFFKPVPTSNRIELVTVLKGRVCHLFSFVFPGQNWSVLFMGFNRFFTRLE